MREWSSWTVSGTQRSPGPGGRGGVAIGIGLMALGLTGCATTAPEVVVDKLDPQTATTVTVLGRPIELFDPTSNPRDGDAFAFLGPFQTDRMGQRELFLWVAVPPAQEPIGSPVLICNGQQIRLSPAGGMGLANPGGDAHAPKGVDLSALNLSRAPYDPPIPWSAQWYFQLPAEGLECLAGANSVSLETRAAGGQPHQFTVDRKSLASLDVFVHRQ